MKRKTCCVIGGKVIPADRLDELENSLEGELAKALNDGYSRLVCGFSGTADTLFALLAGKQKRRNSNLFLEAFLAYGDETVGGDGRFRQELTRCNGIRVFSRRYVAGCFSQRDEEMILESDRVIAVLDRRNPWAFESLCFARAVGKEIRMISF